MKRIVAVVMLLGVLFASVVCMSGCSGNDGFAGNWAHFGYVSEDGGHSYTYASNAGVSRAFAVDGKSPILLSVGEDGALSITFFEDDRASTTEGGWAQETDQTASLWAGGLEGSMEIGNPQEPEGVLVLTSSQMDESLLFTRVSQEVADQMLSEAQ